jgi:exopolysaccharide production protein ExoY
MLEHTMAFVEFAPAAAGVRRLDRSRTRTYGCKRALDAMIALVALVCLAPVMFVLAALVLVTSRGPVFFCHERVGRYGRTFPCIKFRTMASDAHDRLRTVLEGDPSARAEFAATRKLRNDPRVTTVGRFLRQTSLDELPQFVNVLVGHMSLVGPRPIVDDELALYGSHADMYLSVRPGVTGPWQVSGRNDITYAERVELDVAYVTTMSLRRDLGLLVRTLAHVVRPRGAY